MDRVDLLKIILLALALPAQYFISQHWANDNIQQSEALKNLFDSMSKFKEDYLELDAWKKWYLSLAVDLPSTYRATKTNRKPDAKFDQEEEIAIEVLVHRKKYNYFAQSSLTRSPRPSRVSYRVGQVIRHKKYNLYGVIIGWDEAMSAPEDWIERNYETEEKEHLVEQPHYIILVDEDDQEKFTSKVYVPQEHLEVVVNKKIKHRLLSAYFSDFDGGQYLSKKYLRTVYPHD